MDKEKEIIYMRDVLESSDCGSCPLHGDTCNGGWRCYGGEPVEPPCSGWDEDILKMTVAEYEDYVNGCAIAAEEAYDRSVQEKSERIKRNKIERDREKYLQFVEKQFGTDVDRINNLIKKINEEVVTVKLLNVVNPQFGLDKVGEIDENKYTEVLNDLHKQLGEAKAVRDEKIREVKESDYYINGIPRKYEGIIFYEDDEE